MKQRERLTHETSATTTGGPIRLLLIRYVPSAGTPGLLLK